MLFINLTSIRDNKAILLNRKLSAHRVYVGSADVASFPNRLTFRVVGAALGELHAQLRALDVDWLNRELTELESGPVFVIVPFALRVQEEAYTNFRERSEADVPANALVLDLQQPSVFIHGKELPIICAGCSRQAQLKGRTCPDYVPDTYTCFQSSRFALDAMDTFYLTEKGELVYNAASISDEPGEQVESNTATSTTGA